MHSFAGQVGQGGCWVFLVLVLTQDYFPPGCLLFMLVLAFVSVELFTLYFQFSRDYWNHAFI